MPDRRPGRPGPERTPQAAEPGGRGGERAVPAPEDPPGGPGPCGRTLPGPVPQPYPDLPLPCWAPPRRGRTRPATPARGGAGGPSPRPCQTQRPPHLPTARAPKPTGTGESQAARAPQRGPPGPRTVGGPGVPPVSASLGHPPHRPHACSGGEPPAPKPTHLGARPQTTTPNGPVRGSKRRCPLAGWWQGADGHRESPGCARPHYLARPGGSGHRPTRPAPP